MGATLLIVIEAGVIVARPKAARFVTSVALSERSPLCIAVDPHRSGRIYCGTVAGLWRSDDMGQSWIPAGHGIVNARVTAIAIAAADGTDGTVYAGTAPSAVFRSADGGGTWHECRGLAALPSASSWSFPPKPETHHERPGRTALLMPPSTRIRLRPTNVRPVGYMPLRVMGILKRWTGATHGTGRIRAFDISTSGTWLSIRWIPKRFWWPPRPVLARRIASRVPSRLSIVRLQGWIGLRQ